MNPFPLKGYLVLNLAFWAYLVVQFFVLKHFLRDMEGLIFFFFLLGSGFTLVSIYDLAYDRLSARWNQRQQPPESSSAKQSSQLSK
ncbi:MAG: hypothetical protein V2A74_09580 [bacterium]